ncbi:MAG: hypothetical protein IKU67_04095 [Firmicutes bacterium]|nr:hypothetical protein [Bacillota bacterium]
MHHVEMIQKIENTVNNVNDTGLELIIRFIGGMEDVEKYNVNTTPERIEQIKAEEEQKAVEEKVKKEQERMNKPDPYTMNDTMKMLGKQCPLSTIGTRGFMEIRNILEARPHTATLDTAIDIFALGFIYGKRAERSKRKGVADIARA